MDIEVFGIGVGIVTLVIMMAYQIQLSGMNLKMVLCQNLCFPFRSLFVAPVLNVKLQQKMMIIFVRNVVTESEFQNLKNGDRVCSGAWGQGTVEGITKYFTLSSNRGVKYVSVWHDDLNVRESQGKDYAGYVNYSGAKYLNLIESVNFVYPEIPIGQCPECDIEEMIFYEGDYICAWCRERLEQ